MKPKKKELTINEMKEDGIYLGGFVDGIQSERKRVCEIIKKGSDIYLVEELLAKINSEKTA